ncbi:MAG: hypothetical protein CME15_08210 [Gemmatimonadetes bacterium]|nr:hypothetical protein [Gemmatimonadota bacterium]
MAHRAMALMSVVLGHRLLVFHRTVQRPVLVCRLGFYVRIGAVLKQHDHRLRLAGQAGVHDRLPVQGQ